MLPAPDILHKTQYTIPNVDTCSLCVEKQSDSPICTVFVGTLMESTAWLLGKEHDVREVECHAMGTPACVWEITKAPKE